MRRPRSSICPKGALMRSGDGILTQWTQVQEIAAALPSAEQLRDWLRLVGCPSDGQEIGLSAAEVALALECGHYLRNRFTINKLWFLLGLPPTAVDRQITGQVGLQVLKGKEYEDKKDRQ